MIENNKTAKRLYKRITELEDRYDALVEAVKQIIDRQDIKIDEIEEYLEIDK